jgi:hypothetical protein
MSVFIDVISRCEDLANRKSGHIRIASSKGFVTQDHDFDGRKIGMPTAQDGAIKGKSKSPCHQDASDVRQRPFGASLPSKIEQGFPIAE